MLSWAVRLVVFGLGAAAGWLAAPLINRMLAAFFAVFNLFFEITTGAYGKAVGRLVRLAIVVMAVYVGLMGLTYVGFTSVPTGFIPEQDKGYLVVDCTLPEGASLQRTDPVVRELERLALETPGVAHVISVTGYSLISSVNQSNAGGMFVLLEPFAERRIDATKSANNVLKSLRQKFAAIREGTVVAFGAPPVDGLGRTGGFKLEIRDRTNQGPLALDAAADALVEAAAAQPGIAGVFSSFRADQPQLFVDIDRTKVKAQGINLEEVSRTLQVYLGGAYVNDFTAFGRNWQVKLQADAPFRMTEEAIRQLKVRNAAGVMVPLATLATVSDTAAPAIITRYNLYPAADISGGTLPGTSSGESIEILEALAAPPPAGRGVLPPGMDIEWTELALQQILAGDTATFVFLLGTVFVFLVLAAQYESWSLPLAVILIVPMCLLAAIAGVWVTGMANTIFTQIGLVVLVGLSAKNAILIVEFAKQRQDAGVPLAEAVLEAATARLRPILMPALS
ncbi:MAG: efflux RND transporter permease subunit, partial [Pirellulales bacterium]